jgi:hypothetical protein
MRPIATLCHGPQDFAEFVPALTKFFGESPQEIKSCAARGGASSSPQRNKPPSVVSVEEIRKAAAAKMTIPGGVPEMKF